jgi:hypothetical protein
VEGDVGRGRAEEEEVEDGEEEEREEEPRSELGGEARWSAVGGTRGKAKNTLDRGVAELSLSLFTSPPGAADSRGKGAQLGSDTRRRVAPDTPIKSPTPTDVHTAGLPESSQQERRVTRSGTLGCVCATEGR